MRVILFRLNIVNLTAVDVKDMNKSYVYLYLLPVFIKVHSS